VVWLTQNPNQSFGASAINLLMSVLLPAPLGPTRTSTRGCGAGAVEDDDADAVYIFSRAV